MGVVDEVALAEEFFHFFRGQSMPGLDGRTAGHRMEHMVEQIAARHLAFVLNELFREVFHDANEIASRNQRRMRHEQNRRPAELLQFETDLLQQIERLQQRHAFGRGAFDGFRNQQPLTLHASGQNAVAKMFIQNAFVQRVLVDDFQTRVAGDNDVAVVNLDGSEFGSVCCCSLDRPGLFG